MYDPRKILTLCEKATPGPWLHLSPLADWETSKPGGLPRRIIAIEDPGEGQVDILDGISKANAEFITFAREALPEFARRVIELEAILRKIEWIDMSDNPNCLWLSCPYCGKGEIDGHDDNCKLALALTRYD